jgi:uncharacterized repeat protein (TIGR03943 family)
MDKLVKTAVLLGFALFFTVILLSGKGALYVHPRIIPYIWFAVAFLFILAIHMIIGIWSFDRRRGKSSFLYLLFLAPLGFSFVFPPRTIVSSSIAFSVRNPGALSGERIRPTDQKSGLSKNSNLKSPGTVKAIYESASVNGQNTAPLMEPQVSPKEFSTVQNKNTPSIKKKVFSVQSTPAINKDNPFVSDSKNRELKENKMSIAAAQQKTQPEKSAVKTTYIDDPELGTIVVTENSDEPVSMDENGDIAIDDSYHPDIDLSSKVVEVSDLQFLDWYDELYRNIDEYTGRDIIIKGIVLKDSTLPKGEFALVRLMMSCCVADLSPIGVICRPEESDSTLKVEENQWITIKGTITKDMYENNVTPVIVVRSFEGAEPPEDQYVYP